MTSTSCDTYKTIQQYCILKVRLKVEGFTMTASPRIPCRYRPIKYVFPLRSPEDVFHRRRAERCRETVAVRACAKRGQQKPVIEQAALTHIGSWSERSNLRVVCAKARRSSAHARLLVSVLRFMPQETLREHTLCPSTCAGRARKQRASCRAHLIRASVRA